MPDTATLEPPPTQAAPPTGPLADLILVRLLPAKKSLAPSKLRSDVASLFRTQLSAEQIAAAVAALRTEGLVTATGQLLTDLGRTKALAYLGIAALPPKADWRAVKAKYLVPTALGLSPTSADDAKVFGDGKKLAALLLKRHLRLPVGTGTTLNAVFEAIVCQKLGYPEHTQLAKVKPFLLGKAVGSDDPLAGKQAEKTVPSALLNTPKGGIEGLRAVALANLIQTISPPLPPDPEPFDLEAFANTVKSEARTCPTGRFGENKVFISHVWNRLKDEPRFASLGLGGFKAKLIEANRENLLTLVQADLVQLMDPADVRESEITDLNAAFHFVLVKE